MRWKQARYDVAAALAEEALTLFKQIGNPWYIGWWLHQLGRVVHAQGDEQRAVHLFEESLRRFRASGDRGFGTAFQFANVGDVARVRGDYPRATQLYEEALLALRELGFKQGLVHALHSLAERSRAQGALVRAEELHREALVMCRDLGDVPGIAAAMEGLADIAQADGQLERSLRLLANAAALRASIGSPRPAAEARTPDLHLAALRAALGDIRFEAVWRAGEATSHTDAVAYALAAPASA